MTETDAARVPGDGGGEPARRPLPFTLRFIRLALPYFSSSDEKWTARALVALLVVLTVAQVVVPVRINIWSAHLFDALEQKSMSRFFAQIGVIAMIMVASIVINTAHLSIKRLLQINWRRWLTRHILDDWMSAGRQFQVTHLPGEHDNPDGRIAEDVRNTTEAALDLGHSLFYCCLLLVSFVQILWELSGPLEVTVAGHLVSIPGHMVWVALAYSITATTLALTIGWPLIHATDKRQTAEANFRFGLVRGREHAEAIALLHGEADERRRLADLFRGIQAAWHRQTSALARLFAFTSGYSVISTAFPILIAAPRYIAGTITLGQLMQTAQAFQQLSQALSWPVDNLQGGAVWRASVERVLALWDALRALDQGVFPGGHEGITMATSATSTLGFRHLTIANPNGDVVLSDFNCEVRDKEWVLIAGDPVAAIKLFKVVSGLWPWGSGTVELPRDAAIFFMPQRPYLPIGRLRSAVAYPAGPTAFDNAHLAEALDRVGLRQLTGRLDEVGIWEQVLTVSEQQRLGFARLLLHRPDWIFIEEATDSLDSEGEDDMMQLLRQEFDKKATVLTIGYHTTLEAYHQRILAPVDRRGAPRPKRRALVQTVASMFSQGRKP